MIAPKQTAKEKNDCSTALYQTIGSKSFFHSGSKKYLIPSNAPSKVIENINNVINTT